jgi:hypothetical protein
MAVRWGAYRPNMGRGRGNDSGRGADAGRRDQLPAPIPFEDAYENHDPAKLLSVLRGHEVRFVLVGGLAAGVHGSTRPTDDVDVTPDISDENLARLEAALRELGAQARVAGETQGVPEVALDVRTFRKTQSMSLVTRHGFLDLAFWPDGTKGYADFIQAAEEADVLGVSVAVATLDDIIRSKTAAGRAKDLDALGELERLRDAGSSNAPNDNN